MEEDNILKSNRIFQTICDLGETDKKKLLKFLKSPYFNQSKALVALCNELIIASLKGKAGFKKEKIWKKLFPNKEFNDVNFRKSCSDLLDLVEKFMASEIYFNNEERLSLDKMEYISKNKILTLYKSLIQNIEKRSNNKPYLTQYDYYNRYLYEKKYHELMNFDVKANPKLNLEKISENLDIFFLTEKLRIICNAHVHNSISSVEYDLNKVEPIIDLCNKYKLDEFPELSTYYFRYYTLTDGENLDHYFNLKSVLEKKGALMPQSDSIEIYDTVLNYCAAKVNKGNKLFLEEYFEMFLNGIEQRIFILNGELAAWRFNNIIIAGLRLGKMEWATQFINAYSVFIPVEKRKNIVKFNLARVSLYKKEYESVLNHVKEVDYEDIAINLISKTMTVISYYELDEYETLDSFIESFRTFINRQKDIQVNLKQSYMNLLTFVKKLMRISNSDHKSISKLKADILSIKPPAVNQEWLLEKLEELK